MRPTRSLNSKFRWNHWLEDDGKRTAAAIRNAEEKIERERITDENVATGAHHEVGTEVRRTIRKMGGAMPEGLPAEAPIKKLKKTVTQQIEAAK